MAAEMDDPDFSLLSLEDELTCSICLSPFDCPVTIPCGHNFCQDCLLATWKDSYSCPQCRTVFANKPELKKNTVLSTVVETFSLRSSKSESNLLKEETKAQVKDVIRCDTCMEAEASKTCLTCMASYCEEHLRPHHENPNFAVHQLSEPVGDLLERICPDHHKLMELFCSQHSRPICSLCLQHVHKGCSFITPEEQRSLKESDLREKLSLLDMKIERTDSVMFQMTDMQSKLKDGATKRKTALGALYQNMRDLLAQDEREAQTQVDRELEVGQAKLQDLLKKFADNATRMRQAKEDINSLLSESQTSSFLQASFDLPRVVKFEPHVPRINLDSVKVTATQTFATMLKDYLTETLKQPVEERLPIIKPTEGEKPATVPGPQPESEPPKPPEQRQKPSTPNPPYAPPPPPFFQQFSAPSFPFMGPHTGWNFAHNLSPGFRSAPTFRAGQKTNKKSDTSHHPPHGKKSDTGHHPHKQDKRPPSAAGGHKPGGKPPDHTKKDKPKGHPPSVKSTKHPPQPKKK